MLKGHDTDLAAEEMGDQEAMPVGGKSQTVGPVGDGHDREGGQVGCVEEAHLVVAQFGHYDETTVRRDGHAYRPVAYKNLSSDALGGQVYDGEIIRALIGHVGHCAIGRDGHAARVHTNGDLGHCGQRAQVYQRKRVGIGVDDEESRAIRGEGNGRTGVFDGPAAIGQDIGPGRCMAG